MSTQLLTQAPSITMTGVKAAYGRIEVLHGVDLSVPAGSVLALLGPNGAGKSTLLKVLSGRLEETAGEIAIGELTFKHRTAEALARAGVCSIPEGRGIFPNLSVHDNLVMWSYRGESIARVQEVAYQRFPKLKERRRQLAGTLSRLEKGAVSSLVGVTLPGGAVVTASVTNDAVDALGLQVGQGTTAVFKAYSVMVAVAAAKA